MPRNPFTAFAFRGTGLLFLVWGINAALIEVFLRKELVDSIGARLPSLDIVWRGVKIASYMRHKPDVFGSGVCVWRGQFWSIFLAF